ncbi:MAG: FtsX-like permease family protein [Myxococcales bacterium]|nr:FtsX-like permease family protein [Myxococcales bacterium]
MSTLDRKLVRELWGMRWQVLAIVLVVACGIASFVAMKSVHVSLRRSQLEYYQHERFADVWASMARAPEALAARIAEIPDVARVQTRVIESVTLDVPGLPEPANGLLVSIPGDRHPEINDLYLRRGRWITPGRGDEVILNEPFADANSLTPGDELTAILNGARTQLTVVGVAISPEYVYQLSPGSLFPDDRRFGVMWMDRKALASAFDMDGAFNDVSLSVAPGASRRQVIDRLDPLIGVYGGRGAHDRERQASHYYLDQEFRQLESMGSSVPIIFLAVAAFLLNVVLSRMISGQREQIATLKALGRSGLEIGWHYVKLVLVVVLLGAAIGAGLGAWLGRAMLGMYEMFFRFPALTFRLQADVLATAALISLASGLLGALGSVRRAISLPPAEAMRPPAPARYRRGLLDVLRISRLLSQPARMVIRNIGRRPIRTTMSAVGLAMAIAILIVGRFSTDSLDHVMDVNFQRAERHDVQVNFVRPRDREALFELQHLTGVTRVEPTRSVPVRLHTAREDYETAIQGLPADGQLRRLLDADLVPTPLPRAGAVMTDVLGERLGVRPGDEVIVEVLEGERRMTSVVITELVDEMIGVSVYMEIDALNQLLGEGPQITGARLAVDPSERLALYRELKGLPAVSGASLRTAVYDIFNETTVQMQLVSTIIMTLFAAVIAVGVVYNSARVSLAERSRELASLRVIGFTRAEVSAILLGELGVQLLIAVPLGWLFGYGMAAGMVAGLDVELFRFPLIISPRTYAFATIVVLCSGLVAGLAVRRKIDRLDLIAVLKTRE